VAAQSVRIMCDSARLTLEKGFRFYRGEPKEEEAEGALGVLELHFYPAPPEGFPVFDETSQPDLAADPGSVVFDAEFIVGLCSSLGTREGAPEAEVRAEGPPLGYRIDGAEIVFTFDARGYSEATRGDTGGRVVLTTIGMEAVAVAGEFNDWSTEVWGMTRIGERVFELRRPLAEFEGRSEWQFKFVAEGLYWIEPPLTAPNRALVNHLRQTHNLVLRMP